MYNKDKIIFTRKISKVGKAQQMLIYIPVSVGKLVQVGKEYKVTLEELPQAESVLLEA